MSMQMGSVDEVIGRFDRLLRAAFGVSNRRPRPVPQPDPSQIAEQTTPLTPAECRHAAGLMRVNHAGEVCAQALYVGQSFAARTAETRALLDRSADEEFDHLVWCRQRLEELGSHPSRLDPVWFVGSLSMGALAGLLGDRISLGFLAETERQVEAHLEGHLSTLPAGDAESRAIIEAMKADEAHHAHTAMAHGAMRFPAPVKQTMASVSKLMTRTAYFV